MQYGETMNYTNDQKIGLSMAVFLAHDDYDYDNRPNAISATSLLKSPRQLILAKRATETTASMDISAFVAATFGTAIHDGIEKAWTGNNFKRSLKRLGYSEDTIARFKVNPEPSEFTADMIPIYMEKRSEKPLGKFIVVGKFDFVGDGELEDHKTTGVYTYIKGTHTEKYRLQGSIYRWLNQDIITSSRMLVNFIFTDWSALRAKIESGYPPHRMMSVPINLMSIEETEKYITGRLNVIESFINKTEDQLPLCSKEDLWQDATVYKYYKNPAAKDRSTKNFDNFAEAQTRLLKDGSVGCIDIVAGMAKYCNWCSGASICSQARQLSADGLLAEV
jgi:hypothetical protein